MKKQFLYSLSVFTFACCLLVQTVQATVYRPGLFQGKYGCTSSAYPNWNQNLRALAANMTDRTLGTIMADTTGSSSNVVSGVVWNWTGDNMTYGYEGYIWLDAGKTYQVWECNDDGAAIRLNGTFVLSNSVATASGYNEGVRQSTMSTTQSGWHPVEMWTYDWSGGAGPVSAKSGSSTMGLAWNTNGSTTVNSTTTSDGTWSRFRDSGGMTFLKTSTSESFVTVGSLTPDGDNLLASVTINAPTNAVLYLLHGDSDGGELTVEHWDYQMELAAVPPGATTTNLVISGLNLSSSAPYICFYLHSAPEVTGAQAVFEEWMTSFQASGAPSSTVSIDFTDYTAASFTATMVSLGFGGSSADLSVEIASDSDFTSIIETIFVTNGITSTPCTVSGLASTVPLLTNTTYYVRAKGINENSATGFSERVSFTTLTPSQPTASAAFVSKGFDSGTFLGTLLTVGGGSTNAVLYLDLSTTSDFAAYTSFAATNVLDTPPASRSLTATGLDNGTNYYARVRAINTWGLIGTSLPLSFQTRYEPYAVSPIACVTTEGGMQISMSLLDIVSGASVDVALSIGTTAENAVEVESWTGVTSAPQACGHLYPADSGTYVAKYVVTSSYGGHAYTSTYTQTFTVGLNVYVATNLNDLISYRLKVGETVVLPEGGTTYDAYRVLNDRVAELDADGVTLTALEAGGTGIELWAYNTTVLSNLLSTTGGLIVVPEPVGDGKVFLFKESSSSWNWCDSNNWECVTDSSYHGYPDAIDDVAMILYYNQSYKTMTVGNTADPSVTIGELYAGQLTSTATNLRLQGGNSETRTLNFRRSTNDPALIQLTGGAWDSKTFYLYIGGNGSAERLTVSATSDIVFDDGYAGVSDTRQRNHGQFNNYVTVNLPEGRCFKLTGGNPVNYATGGTTFSVSGNAKFVGGGVFWNASRLNANISGDFSAFTGVIRDASYGHSGYDRNANFQFYTTSTTNTTLELRGFVTSTLSPTTSAGYSAWGTDHFYGANGPTPSRTPKKGISLEGGMLHYRQDDSSAWGGCVMTNQTDRLTVGKGLSYVYLSYRDIGSSLPTNTVFFDTLTNTNKGSLVVSEKNAYNGTNAYYQSRLVFKDFATHAIGGAGDPAITSTYPIIPWIIQFTKRNSGQPEFAAVSSDGTLVYPALTSANLDAVVDPQVNAFCYAKSLALSSNRTVNSLLLRSITSDANSLIGEGRTLTLASGGLCIDGNDTIRIGTQNGGVTNGTLAFGNTAYVYSSRTSTTDPAQIYASVVAPQGFVFAGYGNLLLAGNQTGIADELVVNTGTLYLGSLDGALKAQLGRIQLRIVSGNSKVKVNASGALSQTDVRFDDVDRFSGTLELPAGKTEICKKLFIGEGVDSLPRGTYGATGSGADNLDDVHFTGTGVLLVMQDTTIESTVILVR